MFDLEQVDIVGKSAHCAAIRRFVEKAAVGSDSIVLLGEPGVGKERLARLIHQESERREQPLLIVDCSLYYERELKRELFGYQGLGPAAKSRKGLLEFATKGACYLSRVEELSSSLQRSLLDFLRERKFQRLGDGKEITSDARIIVSSDKNLAGFVDGGLFDSQLFRAVSANALCLPPLRERREDIRELVRSIGDTYRTSDSSTECPEFSSEVIEALECFPWPGNYDELEKEVLRLIECGQQCVATEQLSLEIASYWLGRRGDRDVRRVLEELDGYIREFKVLSRLDAEFGNVLMSTSEWDLNISQEGRELGDHLF